MQIANTFPERSFQSNVTVGVVNDCVGNEGTIMKTRQVKGCGSCPTLGTSEPTEHRPAAGLWTEGLWTPPPGGGPGPHLADHGLGQDLGPLGSADDVGGLEEDLGAVLDRPQVPLPPRRHRRQDGFVEEILLVRNPGPGNSERARG